MDPLRRQELLNGALPENDQEEDFLSINYILATHEKQEAATATKEEIEKATRHHFEVLTRGLLKKDVDYRPLYDYYWKNEGNRQKLVYFLFLRAPRLTERTSNFQFIGITEKEDVDFFACFRTLIESLSPQIQKSLFVKNILLKGFNKSIAPIIERFRSEFAKICGIPMIHPPFGIFRLLVSQLGCTAEMDSQGDVIISKLPYLDMLNLS